MLFFPFSLLYFLNKAVSSETLNVLSITRPRHTLISLLCTLCMNVPPELQLAPTLLSLLQHIGIHCASWRLNVSKWAKEDMVFSLTRKLWLWIVVGGMSTCWSKHIDDWASVRVTLFSSGPVKILGLEQLRVFSKGTSKVNYKVECMYSHRESTTTCQSTGKYRN